MNLVAKTWKDDKPKEIGKFCVLCGQPAHFKNCNAGVIEGEEPYTFLNTRLKSNAVVTFMDFPLCIICLDKKIRELIEELQSGNVAWE